MKLSEIAAARRTIPVMFDELTISVTYRLSERTVEKQAELTAEASVAEIAMQLIAAWDVTDDDGEVIPITEEGLKAVPVPVLRAINWAILMDTGLGEVASSSNGG